MYKRIAFGIALASVLAGQISLALAAWGLWRLACVRARLAGGRLSVRPSKPAVVDGYDSGLAAGKKTGVRSGGVVTLGSAAAGDGGGTYRITVDLELSGPQTPSTVTVTLVPQVAGS